MITSLHCRATMQPLIYAICLIFLLSLPCEASESITFSVVEFGAVGDGQRDDTQAFVKAWEKACNTSGSVTISAPFEGIFLLGPTNFRGPCRADSISFEEFTFVGIDEALSEPSQTITGTQRRFPEIFQYLCRNNICHAPNVSGMIVAPDSHSAWDGKDRSSWLGFDSVDRLTIHGLGVLDGRGSIWWNHSCESCGERPKALVMRWCNNTILRGLRIINSPDFHVFIHSDNVEVSGLYINSPGHSPNTDGIHVQSSSHVTIRNSVIHAGDDCVSIGSDSFDIEVKRIHCGPGHGISIGSLGGGGSVARVEDVRVSNATFVGTTNGVRIKTWQGGSGYARNIVFEDLHFQEVENPIVIDQFYCPSHDPCPETETSAVSISNVSYIGATGSSRTKVAIKLACSQTVPCTGILFDDVKLRFRHRRRRSHYGSSSYCSNAQTTIQGTVEPALNC